MDLTSLETAAARLVFRLGGRWQATGAMCLCPAHNDRIPSLSVRVGRHTILLKCFAGCANADIMRAIRQLDFALPAGPPDDIPLRRSRPGSSAKLVQALWHDALILDGSPAQTYLQSRAIDTLPEALRWHPRTPLGRGGEVRFRPAMLAGVEDRGRIIAVQRLFLEHEGFAPVMDLDSPRRTLGSPMSGAVRLHRAGRRLGIAEGVESAESAAILLGLPVWAALGAERLHQLRIESSVERIILLPDNDRAGAKAEGLARATYRAQGFAIETIWPWRGLNDWNDVLRAEREGGRDGVGRAGVEA